MLLCNMFAAYVGCLDTIIKVVLPGNGTFLIIMPHSLQTSLTLVDFRRSLKKEQSR